MPNKGVAVVSIREDIYNLIKEFIRERKLDTSVKRFVEKAIEYYVNNYDYINSSSHEEGVRSGIPIDEINQLKNEFKRFREEVMEELDNIKNRIIPEIRREIQELKHIPKPQKKKVTIQQAKLAFIGKTEPINVRGNIEVSKGQIIVYSEDVRWIDFNKYKCKTMKIQTDDGRTAICIIPDIGFSSISEIDENALEKWFDEEGFHLLKELVVRESAS